jgi:hypothetical protein
VNYFEVLSAYEIRIKHLEERITVMEAEKKGITKFILHLKIASLNYQILQNQLDLSLFIHLFEAQNEVMFRLVISDEKRLKAASKINRTRFYVIKCILIFCLYP